MTVTVASLGDLCDVASGGTPSRSKTEYFDGGIPWVKIGDLLQGNIQTTEESVSALGITNSAAKILPKGTVLISIFATIGRTAVLDIDAATNQAIAGVTPRDSERLDSSYLRRFLDSKKNYLESIARGVAQLNINIGILKSLPVPLPPLSEQRRIASILDQADALRAKRREALAQLDSLTQSIFIEMFGDPNRPSPDKQLLPLGTYCDLFNGYAFKSTDYVEESSTLNCRMSNIRPNGEFDVDYNPRYLPDHFSETHKEFLLRDGDIIIAMTDMASEPKILGVPTIVNSKGKTLLLNQRVGKLVIKAPEKLRVAFLKNLLSQQYARKYLQKYGGGGVQINLGKSDLLSVPIFAPSAEMQDLFGERLEGVDALRHSIQKSIAEHDALFSSLQHCAFRGDL